MAHTSTRAPFAIRASSRPRTVIPVGVTTRVPAGVSDGDNIPYAGTDGAFQPDVTKDGRAVIFRGYTAEGFDVFRVPFAPEAGPVVARVLEPDVALDTEERRWPPRHAGAPIIPPPAPFKGTPMPTELPEGWSIDHDRTMAIAADADGELALLVGPAEGDDLKAVEEALRFILLSDKNGPDYEIGFVEDYHETIGRWTEYIDNATAVEYLNRELPDDKQVPDGVDFWDYLYSFQHTGE